MNRVGVSVIGLLAFAGLLASSGADALPRDPSLSQQPGEPDTPETREARRVRQAMDMDVWLRRLVGRFHIEGVSYVDGQETNVKPAKGLEDCIGLGAGAGVQCVINVVWDEDWGTDGQAAEAGVSSLAPAMIEYGLDPIASKVRYLQVDNQSLAEAGAGVLKGDTLTTRTRCANTAAMPPCERVTRIYAPADSQFIQISIDVEKNHDRTSTLMLYLRRVSQGEAGEGAADIKLPQLPKDQDKSKTDQDRTRSRQSMPRPAPSIPRSGGGRSRR